MCGIIILRGETFRGTFENQIKAYQSIIKHVIQPLKIKDILILVITYYHQDNSKIKNVFFGFKYNLIEIKKNESQVKNFIECINQIPNKFLDNCHFVLILRSDLYFLQDIDYTRANKNVILFQWNLFHCYTTKEMADQIHYIGGNLIKKFKNLINNNIIDNNFTGTLHNLYNFCIKYFDKNNISYLNYIENPDPENLICKIRGNPCKDNGNPLYNYTRFM